MSSLTGHTSEAIDPPAAAAPGEAGRGKRLDIQGLRAIAVLAVIAFHAHLPVHGGFLGVDVFFVISGFVITQLLLRELHLTGGLHLGRFYARRFRRLTPALSLTVAVTLAISLFVLSPLGPLANAAWTGIGAILLCANIVIAHTTGGYFDAPAGTNPLLNTWSLSVEEQFYLVFPALLLASVAIGRVVRRPRHVALLLIAAVTGLSCAAALVTAAGGVIPHFPSALLGFYSMALRAWEFGAGALIAFASARLARMPGALRTSLSYAAAAALAVSLLFTPATAAFPGILTLPAVVATAALIATGCGRQGGVVRLLSVRPMQAVGDSSYSLYLWHWPFIVLATLTWGATALVAVCAALISVIPAVASYKWVETPLRRVTMPNPTRMLKLIAVTVGVPLAIASTVLFINSNGYWNTSIRAFQAAVHPHLAEAAGCFTRDPISVRDMTACTWNSTATGYPIYLVGDSNAEHFSEAVVAAATNTGHPVVIAASPSCPYIDVTFRGVTDDEFSWCRDYVTSLTTWLNGQPPGLVVVGQSDDYWWKDAIAVQGGDSGFVSDPASKAPLLKQGFDASLSAVQEQGSNVLLVQSVPHFRYPEPLWDPTSCSALAIARGSCLRSIPRSVIESEQADARAALESLALEHGAGLLDFTDRYCTREACSTADAGVTRYRDHSHIAIEESLALSTYFQQQISDTRLANGTRQEAISP